MIELIPVYIIITIMHRLSFWPIIIIIIMRFLFGGFGELTKEPVKTRIPFSSVLKYFILSKV